MEPTIPGAVASAAREFGDATALAEPGGPRLSYRELDEQVTVVAAALIAEGVEPRRPGGHLGPQHPPLGARRARRARRGRDAGPGQHPVHRPRGARRDQPQRRPRAVRGRRLPRHRPARALRGCRDPRPWGARRPLGRRRPRRRHLGGRARWTGSGLVVRAARRSGPRSRQGAGSAGGGAAAGRGGAARPTSATSCSPRARPGGARAR